MVRNGLTAEYAVMNFSGTGMGHNTTSYVQQASMSQIEVFMDVTSAYMDSVDWVERYYYFGAMYDMVSFTRLVYN